MEEIVESIDIIEVKKIIKWVRENPVSLERLARNCEIPKADGKQLAGLVISVIEILKE